MATKKLTRDDRMDIAIKIVNELVSLEYIADCTDTDNDDEFNVQDVIERILKSNKLRKKEVTNTGLYLPTLNYISREDYIIWDNVMNKPLEQLDILYHHTSIVELYNDGFKLGVNEEFKCVAELPLRWQKRINQAIEDCK